MTQYFKAYRTHAGLLTHGNIYCAEQVDYTNRTVQVFANDGKLHWLPAQLFVPVDVTAWLYRCFRMGRTPCNTRWFGGLLPA